MKDRETEGQRRRRHQASLDDHHKRAIKASAPLASIDQAYLDRVQKGDAVTDVVDKAAD